MTRRALPDRIAVFSDMHLPNRRDARNEMFDALLDRLLKQEITDLWILGDAFDLLTGSFRFWEKIHAPTFAKLRALSDAGCRILWLEGNHDFHIERLLRPLGVELRDGEVIRKVGFNQIPVYLAHGDLVNTTDDSYLKWRATTRDTRFRALISAVPAFIAERVLLPIAERVSSKSRRTERDPEETVETLYRNFAAAKLQAGFKAVFLGHCHVEDLHVQAEGFYLNLGSWLDGSTRYAIWEPDTEPFPKLHSCQIM